MVDAEIYTESLLDKIKVLNETIWENKILRKNIDLWLNNFETDEEKLHSLYLLSEFMYFGSTQMRQLLKTLYRDLYRYPIVEQIRRNFSDTLDSAIIEKEFAETEKKTRFFGVGNPSESGAHLLYFFRQENKLSKRLFINTDEIFDRSDPLNLKLSNPDLEYYIFIDDFCGSGSQISRDTALKSTIQNIRLIAPTKKIYYLMLFATSNGIANVRKSGFFDSVNCVVELDNTFRCFDVGSRYFQNPENPVDKAIAKTTAYKYGLPLIKSVCLSDGCPPSKVDAIAENHVYGFNDCQLLLGFHHNTPDNTLPIVWYDEQDQPWVPIFRRYNKKYGF